MSQESKVGVIMTGGGARGAYQAGVIKAVCEITQTIGIKKPFSILSGISVGAINMSYMAARADNMCGAASELVSMWSEIHTKEILKTNPITFAKIAFRWIAESVTGGLIKQKKVRSLLDNSPLMSMIEERINFDKIQGNIEKQYIDGLVVTAVNYSDGKSYNFYQSSRDIPPWIRAKRNSVPSIINKDHVIASSALPLYFPPHKIDSHYYADGNLRNNTPLSPPIKLGAEKLLVIPVRKKPEPGEGVDLSEPTLGRIATVLLNSLLLDAIDFDMERLLRINHTLAQARDDAKTELKQIDVCVIRPSENLGKIAIEEAKNLPRSLRYLIAGMGSAEEAEGLISVLLFEPGFTKRLIDLGYRDALNQKEEIIQFYS